MATKPTMFVFILVTVLFDMTDISDVVELLAN